MKTLNGTYLVCFDDSDDREITVVTEAKNETGKALIARVSTWLHRQFGIDMETYEGQVVRVRKPNHVVVMQLEP